MVPRTSRYSSATGSLLEQGPFGESGCIQLVLVTQHKNTCLALEYQTVRCSSFMLPVPFGETCAAQINSLDGHNFQAVVAVHPSKASSSIHTLTTQTLTRIPGTVLRCRCRGVHTAPNFTKTKTRYRAVRSSPLSVKTTMQRAPVNKLMCSICSCAFANVTCQQMNLPILLLATCQVIRDTVDSDTQ